MPLVSKAFGDIITFTRASTGTFFNSAGTLTSAAIDAPRLDYNPSTLAAQGLLIEEARTNSIRNNTMQGAVAGVLGSGGTAPTNWTIASSASGITREVVGTGTENGITYIDLKVSGTSTSSGIIQITPETTTGVAALTGQTWSGTWYMKLVGGSFPAAINWIWIERDSGGAIITTSVSAIASPPNGSALSTQRYPDTRTLSGGASVAYLSRRLDANIPNSTVIDFTLRIGLPQLELGAFATSVIPTTTTALTRSADVASVNTLSPWYNSTSGTLFAEVGYQQNNPSSAQHAASFNDTTANNRWTTSFTQTSSFGLALRNTSGAGLIQTQTANAATVGATNKIALAISTGASLVLNGGTVATNASYAAPTVTQLELGRQLGSGYFNGYIRRITYYPRRLSDAELVSITT